MKTGLTVLLAALVIAPAAVLAACSDDDETGDNADTTSSSGSPSSSSAGAAGGMGGEGVGGGEGGTGGTGQGGEGGGADCDPELTCQEVLMDPVNTFPDQLCPGGPQEAFAAFGTCLCAMKCTAQCAASACMGMPPDQACLMCAQDEEAGCGAEFMECMMN